MSKERENHIVIGTAEAGFSTKIVVKKEKGREEREEREEQWPEDECSFSEELLRVAYVTAISFIPRFIFPAPCVTSLLYPPATSQPPLFPPLRSFPHREARGIGGGVSTRTFVP